MSEPLNQPVRSRSVGSFAVPAGAVLIIVCFFLPWIALDHSSAMDVSGDPRKAQSAFDYLNLYAARPLDYTRVLFLIPILGISTILLETMVPPGRLGRIAVRLGIFAGGAVLCLFFIFAGIRLGPKLAYGFWGSLTGALYILTGALVDVLRDE
jgi:hypothetical protein